jgi:glutathione S-transferase
MVAYKLYYFDFHGGAGEPIRNAFRLSRIPFEDVRIKSEDWPKLKTSDKCFYGQMPLLEIDGQPFAQSMAILRYVGRVAGLYPDDPIEALRVDELLDCCIDIRSKFSATYSLPDAERIAARQKIVKTFLKTHLQKMESRISSKLFESTGFAVGRKLTIADLAIANEVNGLQSGRLDGVDKNIVSGCQCLLKIADNARACLSAAV